MTARNERFSGGAVQMYGEKLRPDIKASVVGRLYGEEGWSLPKLAAHFKVSQFTIQNRLAEAGVPLRPVAISNSRLALIRRVAAKMKSAAP